MTRAAARALLVAAAALAAVGLGAIELDLRHAGYTFANVLFTFRPPSALAALLALGVALAAPVRAIAALRRGDLAAPRGLAILGAVAAALCALATGWQVQRGHAWLRTLIPSQPERWRVFDLVPSDAGVVAVVGAGAALAVALWGIAAFVWARRRGAGPATLATVAASALSAFLAAEGLGRTAAGALALGGDPYGPPELRLLLLDEVNAPLAPLRLAVMIVAALGTVVILALARREPASPSPCRARILAAGVFAAGVTAAVLSRGLGDDVRHPPPPWRDAPIAASSGWTPAVDACPPERELRGGPEVRRRDDGTWLVDGARAADAADAVEALRRKRELWKQVQPKSPFPGAAYLFAGADAPSAEIAPFIAAAREAGYPHIQGIQHLPAKHWPTHTLGDLAYTPRLCGAPIPADLAVRGTWAEALR